MRDYCLSRAFRVVRRQSVSFRHHKLSAYPSSIELRRIRFTLHSKPNLSSMKRVANRIRDTWNQSQTTEIEFINWKLTTMNNLLIEERAWANLQAYAHQLTDAIRRLDHHFNPAAESGWIDNTEVCRLLHISKRTLQYLRASGKLPYSTLGNKCYYKPEDVKALLGNNLTTQCG